LLDLETLWLGRVEDYVATRDQLTPADLTNRKTDEANHNARPLENILAEFRVARGTLLKRVDELDGSLFARTLPHPRLKTPMRLVDHLYFVAEHDDHHLARIWELVP
jgi:DinB family protein